MFFTIYLDVNGHWRWRLQAANNRIIANSGEGYYNKADCLGAINLVKGSYLDARVDAVERAVLALDRLYRLHQR